MTERLEPIVLRGVHCTADFVQRFAELGAKMRVFTDPIAFDTALELASRS